MNKYMAAIPAAMFFAVATASHATVFRIESTQSIVHTTNWSNWWFYGVGLPDDVESMTLEGTFEMSITPGGYNAFTGSPIPDRITFANIDVPVVLSSGRIWGFPSFSGFIYEHGFEGSTDPCFDSYTSPGGSCMSMGDFADYQGSYDGQTISLSGRMNPSSWSNSNGYFYNIVAVAVPEPEQVAYFVTGLGLLLLKTRRKSLSSKSL